jgi:hypothetical protein
MPEQGTRPANRYLPRRRTSIALHADDLVRAENPLRVDGAEPVFPHGATEDFAT